jgi:broad specificity phosphatase PhoE
MARWFIARHGETVFNAAGRIQGDNAHTPLTRAGFAQADEMGAALRQRLGAKPPLHLWSSPSGRALQTLAVICEHLELDWHAATTDPRLREIDMGEWTGAYYRDVVDESGPLYDPETLLFVRRAPGGEDYGDVAERLSAWLGEHGEGAGDRLVLMHGMSSRVLRGLLTGAEPHPDWRVPIAANLPQGSVAEIEAGRETVFHVGSGY